MNFELNEDQEMLKAVAERFVQDRYDVERRRAYLREANGFSRENWELLTELGILSAPFDEEHGGLGIDATGIMVIYQALGKGLVAEPLIANVMLAARLFAQAAPESLANEWLEDVVMGEKRLALAHLEAKSRGGRTWVETQVDADGCLTGEKPYVIGGGGADGFIVSARNGGEPGDDDWAFYFVKAGAAGLTQSEWRFADGSVALSLSFDGVEATPMEAGAEALAAVRPLADLAAAAEALGIMDRLFADTLDYLRTRVQFGQPIGKFQALQHRMVAQYAVLENSRALVELAAVARNDEEFVHAVNGARAYIAEKSVELGHEMIQFHGGMGVTDELAIGHGHKRLLALSRWPDDATLALDRYANAA